jgi:hypothetical protein
MSGKFTVPDDLDAILGRLARDRHTTVDQVIESAVRIYVANAERWGEREYQPASKPFEITPLVEMDECGESDVSENHDRYLAQR